MLTGSPSWFFGSRPLEIYVMRVFHGGQVRTDKWLCGKDKLRLRWFFFFFLQLELFYIFLCVHLNLNKNERIGWFFFFNSRMSLLGMRERERERERVNLPKWWTRAAKEERKRLSPESTPSTSTNAFMYKCLYFYSSFLCLLMGLIWFK